MARVRAISYTPQQPFFLAGNYCQITPQRDNFTVLDFVIGSNRSRDKARHQSIIGNLT